MNLLVIGLGWTVVTLAVVALMGELFARLVPPKADYDCRDADGYADAGAGWGERYFSEWRTVQLRFCWEPFVYWRGLPYRGKYININSDGLRRTWNAAQYPDRAPLRIFLFGGSTMWGAGVRDDGTIPSLLSRLLAAEGIAAQVTNYGQVGYVSTQETIALLRLLQSGDRPDVVVFYDGYNDVLSALLNNEAGLTFREDNRAEEFNILKRSSALARAMARSLAVARTLRRHADRRLSAPEDAVSLAADIARVEIANISAVKALGREFAFLTQFYWQPTIFQKPHLTEYERRQRDMIGASSDLFAQVLGRLRDWKARTHSCDLAILDDVFSEARQPYFLDFVHLSEAGNELVARRILHELASSLRARQHTTSGVRVAQSRNIPDSGICDLTPEA